MRVGLLALLLSLAFQGATLAEGLTPAQLQVLSADSIDAATVEPLYRRIIGHDGTIDKAVAALKAYGAGSTHPRRQRANAWLVASHMQWKFGLRTEAQDSVERGLGIEITPDLTFHQARLFDAAGDLAGAQEWYGRALGLTQNPKRQEALRLRMTFIAAGQQESSELIALAKRRDLRFRNKAAVALALLGRFDDALALQTIQGEAPFRQHLSRAQWALAAGRLSVAQEHGWNAAQLATLARDRRYALAVVTEAHERDDSLSTLLARLDGKEVLEPEEQDLRLDVLQQLGRHDEAIRLFRQAGDQMTPPLRRRLLRMYKEAGQVSQMVAEYRRLIAAEPQETAWVEGLALHLIDQGDRHGAAQLWEAFNKRNDTARVLLSGASSMGRLGFYALAVSATEKSMAVEPDAVAKALAARFELHLQYAQMAAAEQVLVEMDGLFAPDASARVDLADGYERMHKPLEALRVLEALHRSRVGGVGTDERMHMARLYASTGKSDQALAVWKELWSGELKDASRRLVEDRLLKQAAETGALGSLAVELEQKLADGVASKRDSSLLIRLYTQAGDHASAVEVIRESFGSSRTDADEIESLREQAGVYRLMGRHKAFRKVTARLVERDPENRLHHLQALVLDELENGDDRGKESLDRLLKLLAQLRMVPGLTAGAEYEAGVLELAGFVDWAIATYRVALAQHPDRADNYLMLTDLLRKRAREPQAIALLQYLVENADHDEAFMIGIDGILNLKAADNATLQWAQRRVLERLTARDDKLYLYELLAELAESAGNTGMYFSALENALVHADSNRSLLLRELTAASDRPSPADMRSQEHSGDASGSQRSLRYSRRLIALREALPPDVYTDMGEILLGMGDADGATDAFNFAIDLTGEPQRMEQAGDLLRDHGFPRHAALQYEKAWIADARNFPLMRKLADMRMRQGDDARAAELYARAALEMLQELPLDLDKTPAGPPLLDTVLTHTYKQNYGPVLTGLLRTVRPDQDPFAILEQAFENVLAQSIQSASNTGVRELAYYPRLHALSEFMRDAASRDGSHPLAGTLEARLLRHFDRGLRPFAGAKAQPLQSGVQWTVSSRQAVTQALEHRQYDRAIALALYQQDPSLVASIYRQWITELLRQSPEASSAVTDWRRPGDILADAELHLDVERFGSLSRHVFELVADQPGRARELLNATAPINLFAQVGAGPSSLVARMEQASGRVLLSNEALREALFSGDAPVAFADVGYVMNRLSPEEQMRYLERQLQGPAGSNIYVRLNAALPVLGIMLRRPLTAEHSAHVVEIVGHALRKQTEAGEMMGAGAADLLRHARLARDAAAANHGMLEALERALIAIDPAQFQAGLLTLDLRREQGRLSEALDLLVSGALARYAQFSQPQAARRMPMEESPADRAVRQYLSAYGRWIYPDHKAAAVLRVRNGGTQQGLEPAAFSVLWSIEQADPQMTPVAKLRWLENMAMDSPNDETTLRELARAYAALGYVDLQIGALEKLVALKPQEVLYRQGLFAAWWQLRNPVNALKAASDRLETIVSEEKRAQTRQQMAFVDPFERPPASRSLASIRALEKGGSADEARCGLRGIWQQLPGSAQDSPLQYAQLFNLDWMPGAPQASAGNLTAQDGPDEFGLLQPPALLSVQSLLGQIALNTGSRKGKLLDRLVDFDFSVAEFESQVRTLDPREIDQQYRMYALLARAYEKHGRLRTEVAALTGQLEGGRAGPKERVLWLELVSRLTPDEAVAHLGQMEALSASITASGGYERLLLAHCYARAGDQGRAADIYLAMAFGAFEETGQGSGPAPPFRTAAGLYADAAEHLSDQGLERFAAALLQVLSPDRENADTGAYEAFVAWMLERTPALRPAQTRLAGFAKGEAHRGWSLANAIGVAGQLARQHRYDDALTVIAPRLQSAEIHVRTAQPPSAYQQMARQRYTRLLGLSAAEGPAGADLIEFARLFPDEEGTQEWIGCVRQRLVQWMQENAVAREPTLNLMALMTLRQHQMGLAAQAQESAKELAMLLQPVRDLASSTASLGVEVMLYIQAPMNSGLLNELIEQRRLDVRLVPLVLRQVAETDGSSAAIALGEVALTYTQDPEVLSAMKALATTAGRADLEQSIAKAESEAVRARETVARRMSAYSGAEVQARSTP